MRVQSGQTDHFRIDIEGDSKVTLRHIIVERRGPIERTIGYMRIDQWKRVAERALNILVEQATEDEEDGIVQESEQTLLAVMPGREIVVLFWALLEDEKEECQEAIFHGWRELAREERWWLYRKCSMPGQGRAQGWRRALYYALGDVSDRQETSEAKRHSPKGKSRNSLQMGLFE